MQLHLVQDKNGLYISEALFAFVKAKEITCCNCKTLVVFTKAKSNGHRVCGLIAMLAKGMLS